MDNVQVFLETLKVEEDFEKVNAIYDASYEAKAFVLNLRTAVGSATFEQDLDDYESFCWTIFLGPVNSQKLIAFLRTLEEEPGEDA